ncbi:MAG: RelA/SpoT family protein, partial [Paludibacteraceae bacterium]|nr:RelA/SpoT family protein [Paludibacteraceae bacterium]
MTDKFVFTTAEKEEALALYTRLKELLEGNLMAGDEEKIRTHLVRSIEQQQVHRDVFGLNPILSSLQTALIMVDEIGLKRDAV